MAKKREITLEEVLSLSHEELASLLYTEMQDNRTLSQKVEKRVLASDPEALVKSIKKDIGSIKRGRKFIGYYDAFAFADKVAAIVEDIETLVKDKKLAASLYKELILTDSKVYLRSDDSSGAIQMSYAKATDGWKMCLDVLNEDEIYRDIMQMRVCEGFGIRDVFSEKVPHVVLEKIYDQCFQQDCEDGERYDTLYTMLACAHYLKDPERYIDALKQGGEALQPYHYIDIAKEYQYAQNPKKVLETLERLEKPGKNREDKFYALQIWAYDTLHNPLESLRIYKAWYEATYSVEVLKHYLERVEGSMKEEVLQKALRDAVQLPFRQAMHFFRELDAVDLAAKYILTHSDSIETEYLYAKEFNSLVKWLRALYPQEAILLCRDQCEKQLATSQSKYYPSAINALKKAIKIEEEYDIREWHIEENITYMQRLFEKHRNKPKFVQLFTEAGLGIAGM